MNDLAMILAFPLLIGFLGLLYAIPDLIWWGLKKNNRDRDDRERQYHRLQRKISIAEEASAARARGETYTPPEDWKD